MAAIRAFPVRRQTEHRGLRIAAKPFDHYEECPHWGARITV
jgi:hypothetical protein